MAEGGSALFLVCLGRDKHLGQSTATDFRLNWLVCIALDTVEEKNIPNIALNVLFLLNDDARADADEFHQVVDLHVIKRDAAAGPVEPVVDVGIGVTQAVNTQ